MASQIKPLQNPGADIQVYEDPYEIELSEVLEQIEESSTLRLNAKKLELEAQGQEIYGFTAGELSFPVEPHVALAMISTIVNSLDINFDTKQLQIDPIEDKPELKALHEAVTALNKILDALNLNPKDKKRMQYTPVGGTKAFKEAVAEKLLTENSLEYATNEIIGTAGAKEAIAEALRVLVRNGEGVLILQPGWVSYKAMTELAGGTPVLVQTDPENDFKITPQQLREALQKNPNIKSLILNSPNNPSGAVYSRQEIDALAEVLKDFPKVVVISDEIYEKICYEDKNGKVEDYYSMAQAKGMKKRTVTINGGSKVFAMTGLRIGYAAGPKKVIKAMEKIQGHSSGNPNVLAQAALIAALKGPKDFLKKWMKALTANRNLVVGELNKMGLKCKPPKGAFYAYADVSSYIGKVTPNGETIKDASDFADHLLKNGVLVVPGHDFGNDNYIRLSFAAKYDYLEKGLDRMATAVAKLVDPKLDKMAKTNFKENGKDVGNPMTKALVPAKKPSAFNGNKKTLN